MTCKSIEVRINNEGRLVTKQDVRDIIEGSKITGVGKPLDEERLKKLRGLLETKSYMKDLLLYATGDSVLHVEFKQRIPAIRVAGDRGAWYYIDSELHVFPASMRYAYDVPVVTGQVQLPPKGKIPEKETVFVEKLLEFATFVASSPFWNAQIQQIHIDGKQNVEFTVTSERHLIRLGQLDGYRRKMEGLLAFYRKVNSYTGDSYRILDLRFENQIIAVKNV
ncbi:MAG: cell division protein FtsQ/DivIB [Prevotellaceae bacterium]|nr:cell division protein FtsQ/DivIB [Prevotellaceae bacterium]